MKPWVKQLNDALKKSGWSKTELARRSGVNYDSLNKVLSGKVEHPRGDTLPRVARALGVKTKTKTGPAFEKLTQLGGADGGIPKSPEDAVLETVVNPHTGPNPGGDYLIRFTCPEFTSLCPVTGQPDFAHLVIDYVPGKLIIESKSLKLFLASWRNHAGFHEACTTAVAVRLVKAAKPKWLRIGGYWYPRGGIPIDVFYQTGTPPKGLWIPDQGVPPYRGRG